MASPRLVLDCETANRVVIKKFHSFHLLLAIVRAHSQCDSCNFLQIKTIKEKILIYLRSCQKREFNEILRELCTYHNFIYEYPTHKFCSSRIVPSCEISSAFRFTPFSRRNIWINQQKFYLSKRLDAWDSDTVPLQISSNPFVALYYIRIIQQIVNLGKLQSFKSQYKDAFTYGLTILEVGAGHGLLSLLIARELQMLPFSARVICTDFHSHIFDSLLQLSWVRDLCNAGHLDFAVCKVQTVDQSTASTSSSSPTGLQLLYKGIVLKDFDSQSLVIIGNYAFDSFPVDLVCCNEVGQLFEIGEVSVSHPDKTKIRPSTSSNSAFQTGGRMLCGRCFGVVSRAGGELRCSCDGKSYAPGTSIPAANKKRYELNDFGGSESNLQTVLRSYARSQKRFLSIPTEQRHHTASNRDGKDDGAAGGGAGCELEPGTYVIPTAAFLLFKTLASMFSCRSEDRDTTTVGLIAGDRAMFPDDLSWWGASQEGRRGPTPVNTHQTRNSDGGCDGGDGSGGSHNDGKGNLKGADIDHTLPDVDAIVLEVDGFDPPLISPCASACAVPVMMDTLATAFELAFGGEIVYYANTPTHTDFCVGVTVLSMNDAPSCCDGSFSMDRFGPNEYNVIREALLWQQPFQQEISLEFLENLLRTSNDDFELFLDLRWIILGKITGTVDVQNPIITSRKRRRNDAGNRLIGEVQNSKSNKRLPSERITDKVIRKWVDIAVSCFQKQYAYSSVKYDRNRAELLQWLTALLKYDSKIGNVILKLTKVTCIDFLSTLPSLTSSLDDNEDDCTCLPTVLVFGDSERTICTSYCVGLACLRTGSVEMCESIFKYVESIILSQSESEGRKTRRTSKQILKKICKLRRKSIEL